MAVLTALLLALQADAPSAVADAIRKTLLLAEPGFHVLSAVSKTRAEKSYEVLFDAVGAAGAAPLGKKGSALRCAPGVLLLDVDTARTKKTQAIRVGDQVWVYAPLFGEWLPPDEAGETGIAYGLTNPDELLRLIAQRAWNARFKGKDLEIALQGAPAVALANKLTNENWVNARVDVRLQRDAAGRLASIDLDVAAANAQGPVNLTAAFQLGRYGQVAVPAKMGTIAFSKRIQTAIAAQLNR
jgi:hypothetical protein